MTRERHWFLGFSVLAALALPLGALAQEIRLGTEFQVNTYTTSNQSVPSVAADADGDFVVAWRSFTQDGSGYGIFAHRFSSAGAPLASEFQVNTYTTANQRSPSVAADADGDFVVAWDSSTQDGSFYGVFARRFSSTGEPVASEFQVNTYTTSQQSRPSVAADADGDFVVAWSSSPQDGSDSGVFAHRFSSAGAPLATEFQVNTYTTDDQRQSSVAADADGDFVVAWDSSIGQDGSSAAVFARRFSSAGAPLATEFQVNTYTFGPQNFPSVAAEAGGDFVVAWGSSPQDGSSWGLFARRFSSAGAPLASEFQVNTYTTNGQYTPSVAADADGDFVVAWQSYGQEAAHLGIFARRFSSAGAPLATEFQVNTYTTSLQSQSSVAVDADGDFVVAWNSYRDGSSFGVFAQRFAAPAILDVALNIDGNGAVDALTDGLLVLRFLFGFTGSTLTTGAVGGGCTRCDATAIEPYVGGLGLVLDVDGDTMTGALTDGLLVLRFLFGFTGSTLITGAVGGSCTRCDAAAIETYLAGLTT